MDHHRHTRRRDTVRLGVCTLFAVAVSVIAACGGNDKEADVTGAADHTVDLRDVSPAGTRMPVRVATFETVDVIAEDPTTEEIRFSVDGVGRSVGEVRPGVHRFVGVEKGVATVRARSEQCAEAEDPELRSCTSKDHGAINIHVIAD